MRKNDATILIVDDSSENRHLVELILSSSYPNLLFAKDGAEALSILMNYKIDLVISDYEMPGTDGKWLLDNIQNHGVRTKVIIVSGSIHIDEEKVLAWGGKMFLQRPYSAKLVLQMICELLEK